jgi:hypothetical protein
VCTPSNIKDKNVTTFSKKNIYVFTYICGICILMAPYPTIVAIWIQLSNWGPFLLANTTACEDIPTIKMKKPKR